jgi:hypothetical protein
MMRIQLAILLAATALNGCAVHYDRGAAALPGPVADPLYDRAYAPSPSYRIGALDSHDGYSVAKHREAQVVPLDDRAPHKR